MFDNPRRGRQAKNFTTNFPKILVLKCFSEPIFHENCRSVPLKALWRKWHYPLISMHLKCKQRLQKCPNGQVMSIFGRSPKNRIFRKSAKGRTREVFQKSPKLAQIGPLKRGLPSLQWANSTLPQMSLSSKLYLLIMQRLKKILAQKAAPKVPEWPSYGNFGKVTQNPQFSKKQQRGDQGKFVKNHPKSSPRLKGPKALWRKWHYPLISLHLKCKDWTRFRCKRPL